MKIFVIMEQLQCYDDLWWDNVGIPGDICDQLIQCAYMRKLYIYRNYLFNLLEEVKKPEK